jgi:hypothetical protein
LTQAGFIHAQADELSYWYRPPRGSHAQNSTEPLSSAPPVVLLHGIGLGLVPYLGFLQRVINQHGNNSTIICPVRLSGSHVPPCNLPVAIGRVRAGISAYRATGLCFTAILCCDSNSHSHHALPSLSSSFFTGLVCKWSWISLAVASRAQIFFCWRISAVSSTRHGRPRSQLPIYE